LIAPQAQSTTNCLPTLRYYATWALETINTRGQIMSIVKFGFSANEPKQNAWHVVPKSRRVSALRCASGMALVVLWSGGVLSSAAAQAEDPTGKPPTQAKPPAQAKIHTKRKKSERATTGEHAKTKLKVAPVAAAPPQDTTAYLASLDKTLGHKGWNGAFPSFADTLTQDFGGYRSKLAEYGFGFIAIDAPLGAVNMLNSRTSGPGPLMGPGRPPSSQQYWGQVPSGSYGAGLYLTYDMSRHGVPDGQIAVSGTLVASSWDHFLANRVGLNELSWYQTLFDKKVELKIGYLHNGQEFVGGSIGGTFASPFGQNASIPYAMGISPIGAPEPTVRTTWHITDNIYNQVAAIRSLPINGPTGNLILDDTILNPTGFKFAVPNGGLLIVDELGWKNEAAPGSPKTWVRAGAMYNDSRFANFRTGGTNSGVAAGYFLADRQLSQVAPGSPSTAYRGLYAGVSAMYAPPEYLAFSQYYEARLYSLGLFDSRPEDLILLTYSRNEFSHYLVSNLDLSAPQTGIFAAGSGSNTVTFAYTAKLRPGQYFTVGASYTDHPSLAVVKNQGSDLNLLLGLVDVW
jgi:porin